MATKGEKTREFIIDESYKLFAKNGFSKVTMKDVCEATSLSRGGLYSHFDSTKAIFEALLEKLNQKGPMDFAREIAQGMSAREILENALELLEEEMKHPEDSLSIAMFEYSGSVDADRMEYFNNIGEKKWTDLIVYGIRRGEFREVSVTEIVNIILYAYQGIRMWSCIIPITEETILSITNHIRKQLIGEEPV